MEQVTMQATPVQLGKFKVVLVTIEVTHVRP